MPAQKAAAEVAGRIAERGRIDLACLREGVVVLAGAVFFFRTSTPATLFMNDAVCAAPDWTLIRSCVLRRLAAVSVGGEQRGRLLWEAFRDTGPAAGSRDKTILW